MDGPKLSYKRHIEKIQQVENVGTWFSIIFWKKSQNKTSQASQKPAKTFLSLISINISSLPYHLGGSVGRAQAAVFGTNCGREFESHLWVFWKIFFHHWGKGVGALFWFSALPQPITWKWMALETNFMLKNHSGLRNWSNFCSPTWYLEILTFTSQCQ